ncbi:type II secretion system protein M [Acinetobacter guerrae]|uniref:Type II secretion system protein M n=2 Tax=Acinetobacter guerrae TaxID=1843371 RepID=A0A3A8EUZ3_9GAMM|nr:type II secretion system protein GspM [Acinetobacter guerrae]RKG32681.1 type II secretion system protein M [Acinetobacter guerrae]
MNTMTRIQHSLDQKIERIVDALQRMSVRERYMVIFASVLVVVSIISFSLWKMHSLADQQQKRVNDLKDLMVWMQSNAVTMKPASESQLTIAEKVQRVSQQQGLTVSSQQMGEQLQIVAEHQNYAVLANFITQLAKMGVSIEKMEMVSGNNQIKLTATVQ